MSKVQLLEDESSDIFSFENTDYNIVCFTKATEKNNKKIKKTRKSATGYVDIYGSRNKVRKPMQQLPVVGTIILYNTVIDSMGHAGYPPKGLRGIGKVIAINKTIIRINKYVREDYVQTVTFQTKEIINGLVEYKELKDYRYCIDYSYEELDINNPHTDIKNIMYVAETTAVVSHHQGA